LPSRSLKPTLDLEPGPHSIGVQVGDGFHTAVAIDVVVDGS